MTTLPTLPQLTTTTLLGPLGSVIEQTFARVELAEEEIAAAKRRHPLAADLVDRAFAALCPTDALREASERLYRAHCRELLERAATARDLREATTAEVVAVLSTLSLAQPLSRGDTLLYLARFRDLFPEQAAKLDADDTPLPTPDRYEHDAMAEREAEIRRKLRVPRGLSVPR